MTNDEYLVLLKKYGEYLTIKIIDELSSYKISTGKEYANDYATLVRWLDREKEKLEKGNTTGSFRNYEKRYYTPEFLERLYDNL